MQSSTSTTISGRPRSITSASSWASVFGVGPRMVGSFMGSGPVRQRTARQRRARPQRPVRGEPLFCREGKKRFFIAKQEIEHEAEEFGIGGAFAHLVSGGAGSVKKPAGKRGPGRDPAKGPQADQFGRLSWQRGGGRVRAHESRSISPSPFMQAAPL